MRHGTAQCLWQVMEGFLEIVEVAGNYFLRRGSVRALESKVLSSPLVPCPGFVPSRAVGPWNCDHRPACGFNDVFVCDIRRPLSRALEYYPCCGHPAIFLAGISLARWSKAGTD